MRDDVMQFFVKIMQEENLVLNWMERMWLKKILIKNYIIAHKIEDEIKDICYLELVQASNLLLDETIETILESRDGVIDLISDLS